MSCSCPASFPAPGTKECPFLEADRVGLQAVYAFTAMNCNDLDRKAPHEQPAVSLLNPVLAGPTSPYHTLWTPHP